MRFSMALSVPPSDLKLVRPVEQNCSKHLSVVNDIWSYEKEVLAAETLHEEGGTLCTAVAVLARDAEIGTDAAKRVLYHLCREWEHEHQALVAKVLEQRDTPVLRAYMQGLEFLCSQASTYCCAAFSPVQSRPAFRCSGGDMAAPYRIFPSSNTAFGNKVCCRCSFKVGSQPSAVDPKMEESEAV